MGHIYPWLRDCFLPVVYVSLSSLGSDIDNDADVPLVLLHGDLREYYYQRWKMRQSFWLFRQWTYLVIINWSKANFVGYRTDIIIKVSYLYLTWLSETEKKIGVSLNLSTLLTHIFKFSLAFYFIKYKLYDTKINIRIQL